MYPKEMIDRACLPNNKSGMLISIKALEMVCIIANMAAAIFVCDHYGYLSVKVPNTFQLL